MSNIALLFSADFEAFLEGLNPERASLVTNALKEFVKGELDLDTRLCDHTENRNKVLLHDANVVVYYDKRGDTLVLINGKENAPRVA